MEWGNPILVAVLTLCFTTIVATVPATITAVSSKKVHKSIGETNGKGSIAEMLSAVLSWQGEHATLDTQEFNLLRQRTTELTDQLQSLDAYTHERWKEHDEWLNGVGMRSDLLVEVMRQLNEIREKQLEIEDKTTYLPKEVAQTVVASVRPLPYDNGVPGTEDRGQPPFPQSPETPS